VAAVLAMALASLQAAPLALAAALFWAEGAWVARQFGRNGDRRAIGRLTLAFAPAFLPTVFGLVVFGRPSPLHLAGAYDVRHVSAVRALELVFDLNLGLLPYVPLALTLGVMLPVLSLACRRTGTATGPGPRSAAGSRGSAWLLVAAALVALASTGAANWNHGTVGPSRYGLWLLPFLFVLLAEALEVAGGRLRRVVLPLAVLAVLSQAAITLVRGGVHAPEDYTRHSPVARWVLDRWPALYNPTTEIFIERTEHREINPDLPRTDAVVYRSADGCRKAWLQKRHIPDVAPTCGGPPIDGPDFRTLKPRPGPDAWAYVSW
jgi:hypothetical protein